MTTKHEVEREVQRLQQAVAEAVAEPETVDLAGITAVLRQATTQVQALRRAPARGETVAVLADACTPTSTGVDVSARQLELARRHAPEALLIKASMTAVDFAPATFDAVVALYSIIHVPRTEHPSLLRRIHTWLKPGGLFLATWAIDAWEGQEDNWEGWGAAMWWSHYDAETNLQMLREAGFHIDVAETRASGNEPWLWVLARAS